MINRIGTRKRRITGVFLILTMLISMIPINGAADTETTVIYHETFAEGMGAARQSGGASLTPVSGKVFEGNDDGYALYVGNRSNNWDAADFLFGDTNMENGKTYSITVKGYVDEDAQVPEGSQAFLQTIGSYGWLSGANLTTGEAFTLTGTYTVDTSKDEKFRIQSNDTGKTVPFYIGDVLVTGEAGEPEEPGEEPERPPAEPFTDITFEDGQAGGFTGRAGTEALTVTDEANHTAGGTYALKVEGRTSTWHGPSLRIERYIDKGAEYTVSAWVKLIDPESSQIQLSTQVGNGSSASYNNLSAKTISTQDGWVNYTGTYRYNNVSSEYITLYVESSNNATASFYIDDITFQKTGSEKIEIQKDLIPLKDAYADYFLIGNAISAEDMDGVRLELLKMHYNSATAGNAMKPDALQPSKGNFAFTAADALIDKALAEGLQMHGHTLVWHQQSPAWMNTSTDEVGNTVSLGREEALENLRTHIRTVMEHFGDKVISWDVVNEAMSDNPPQPANWQGSLRQAPWYNAIGDDYVEQAFLAAREVLDDHPDWDIKLYYNDYNLDNQNKSLAVYNMVNEINTRYQEEHPGKLLIDGVGMQGHYRVNTNPTNVRLSLERFISLGVEVSFTELDIQTGDNYQLPEELAVAQGYLYAQLFNLFKEYKEHIARVTIWGLDDGTSWRSSTNPTLFDKNLQAKPAYYGAVDPDKFIAENTPTTPEGAKRSTAAYGTPEIDGETDSVWNSTPSMALSQYQMAWQGATGTAKALWDDENLYILISVEDTELDKTSPNTYEQDSVEVFVDENNGKTHFYQEDDGQYRINYDNETSFSPPSVEEGFESAVKVTGTNYTVEIKIPFKFVRPANDAKLGFDAQVNDAKNGSRQSVAAWNDTTGNAYQDTSVFGELTLTGKPGDDNGQPGEGSTPGTSSGQSGANPAANINEDGTKVTVTLPLALNKDGSGVIDLPTGFIDGILSAIRSSDEGKAPPVVTLELTAGSELKGVTLRLSEDATARLLAVNTEMSLRISSDLGEVTFDSKALSVLSKVEGSTEISFTKVLAEDAADRPSYTLTVTRGGKAVTDFSGGRITVGLPYTASEDENPDALVVYRLESSGGRIPVRSTYKEGTITFITDHFSKFEIGYSAQEFDDVQPGDTAYGAFTYLAARQVVVGSVIEPHRAVTRGEAVVMLMKAYGISPSLNLQDNFIDGSGENAGYYAKAKSIGITHGVGSNRIGADLPLTREMLFTLTYNLLVELDELPQAESGSKALVSFSDYDKVSSWAVKALETLSEAGLLAGTGNNLLSPGELCTKEDFAQVLYRLLNR